MTIPTYKDIVINLGADSEKLLEFFIVFSRAEYALKKAGYVTERSGYPQTDWNAFAADIAASFEEDASENGKNKKFINAVAFLNAYPPKKQVLSAGALDFADDSYDGSLSRTARTFELVRRVRNNTFHGAKSEKYDPHRDGVLIDYATTILLSSLEYLPTVSRFYASF